MYFRKQLGEYWQRIFDKAHLTLICCVSATLIAVNWLIYIWAITNDHMLAASLGYYLNPLVNVLLGPDVSRRATAADAVGRGCGRAAGRCHIDGGALDTLWVSVSLALQLRDLYGLIRKITPVGSVPGLAVETSLLAPLSLAAVFWFAEQRHGRLWQRLQHLVVADTGGRGRNRHSVAAIRDRRAANELCQPWASSSISAPSIAFLLGVFVYGEPLSRTKLAIVSC